MLICVCICMISSVIDSIVIISSSSSSTSSSSTTGQDDREPQRHGLVRGLAVAARRPVVICIYIYIYIYICFIMRVPLTVGPKTYKLIMKGLMRGQSLICGFGCNYTNSNFRKPLDF